MSDTEWDCRLSLANAYAVWAFRAGKRPLNWLAYCHALGVEGY